MTLDETIRYAEEVIEDQERSAVAWRKYYNELHEDIYPSAEDACIERAKKYRQIAEYLKELKQLRKQTKWTPVTDPLNELPKDKHLLVTVAEEGYSKYVDELYYDMTEWTDDMVAKNTIAYQCYPEPYEESEEKE